MRTLNNKGLSLLEMLVVLILVGIIVQLLSGLFLQSARTVARLSRALKENEAIAPGADQRTYLPTLGVCVRLKGTPAWYAKRQGTDTVGFYLASPGCTGGYIGTLNTAGNPTYDDDTTDTFWNVSSSGSTTRVLVRKLNLPKP